MAPRDKAKAERDFVETATFWVVGIALAAVPALVFFFSFGNVGLLGTGLGVDHWIAFLTGPAVDLSVAGCVIAASYLSAKGRTERELWPLHTAAIFCGFVMVALNTGGAIYVRHWRLAAFDSVGPALLIGWGFIAPWLWRNLTDAKRGRPVGGVSANRQRAQPPLASTVDAKPGDANTPPTENSQPPVDVKPAANTAGTVDANPRAVRKVAAANQSANVDANTGEMPTTDRWVEVAEPVYRKIKDETGSRPAETAFTEALSAEVDRLIAAGDLSPRYASPSKGTAKRIRTEVEQRFPELAPLRIVPSLDQESAA